ncbi:MAG: response regulator [Spirochaetia bacterium]
MISPIFGTALFTIMLIISIFCFIGYLFRKKNKSALLLSVMAFLVGLRVFFSSTVGLIRLIPSAPVLLTVLTPHIITLAIISVSLLYMQIRMSQPVKRTMKIAFSTIWLPCAVLLFVLIPNQSFWAFSVFALFAGLAFIYQAASFYQYLQDWSLYSVSAAVSAFLLWVAVVHEVLVFFGVLGIPAFSEFIYSLFCVLEALVILLMLIQDYAKAERSSEQEATHEKLSEEILLNAVAEALVPVDGVLGITESMIHEQNLKKINDSALPIVFTSQMRLKYMLYNIRDYLHIQSQPLELQKDAVKIDEVIDFCMEIMKPYLDSKSITIEYTAEDKLPVLYLDEDRITQVFINLFNVISRNVESAAVTLSIQQGKESVDVALSGNLPEVLYSEGEIYLAFQHDLGNVTHPTAGTGIEAIMVKLLTEQLGGAVKMRSKTDTYSVYELTFPLSEIGTIEARHSDLALHRETLQQEVTALEPIIDTDKFKLLVVDDDPVSLQVMKNYLLNEDYVVDSTGTGEGALAIIESSDPPDLLLLDIMMPKMSGLEVCERVRKKYSTSELPIILTTAKSKVADMAEGLIRGANDYLAKPFTRDELVRRVRTHLELSKLNTIYGRFIPKEFLRFLGHDNIVDISLGEQVQKEMTILFVDIRSFTSLSENMSPQENFKFINSYLSRISPIIKEHNGFIDKYIGDSIMALFPFRPEDAIDTAVEMIKHVTVYNQHRHNSGYVPIKIGIGIHTGKLILGIIGDKQRMEGTVISDAVNLASRVQDLTKLYGANILISQDTFIRLDNPTDYFFRFLGRVKVKGKEKTVSVFEIFNGEEDKIVTKKNNTKNEFETAIIRFAKRNFDEAREIFSGIVKKCPQDRAAQLFLQKIKKYSKSEGADTQL